MLLNEILTSAKQNLSERLTSPLLGSFVVAWCLWNWKFLLILFSNTTVSQTFALVDKIAFPDWNTLLARGLILPLASAFAYIFVYPYPARFVYAFSLRRQREINQTKQKIANETLLTLAQSLRLRAEYVEHERKQEEQFQILNEEIARLKSALDTAQKNDSMRPLTSGEKFYNHLEPSQLSLLKAVETIGSPAIESELIEKSAEPKIQTEFDIGELIRRKLLKRDYDVDNGHTLAFTHEGRRALLQSNESTP